MKPAEAVLVAMVLVIAFLQLIFELFEAAVKSDIHTSVIKHPVSINK